MSIYWAVIADLVRSRSISARGSLQADLERVLAGRNARDGGTLAAKWTITIGDEFQALFRSPRDIPFAIDEICNATRPYYIRVGLGWGSLTTELKPVAIGMDGPCFHRAREALEAARRAKRLAVVRTHGPVADLASDVWNLALTVAESRTAKQGLAVSAYRLTGRQEDVARLLDVSQGTVSVDLRRARMAEVDPVLSHLGHLLEEAEA